MKNMITAAAMGMMLCQLSQAEYRTWVDNEGHQLKAELLESMNGHITLQTPANKLIHISISSLSANDQKYILAQTPPKVGISVVEISDVHSKGFEIDDNNNDSNDEDVSIQTNEDRYKATLTAEGAGHYNGTLKAEMYIMGARTVGSRTDLSRYILLSKTVSDVSFGGAMNNTFSFTSAKSTFRDLQSRTDMGTQYAGYLVVLLDGQGRMFENKASRSVFSEHIATIRKMKEGDVIPESALSR